MRNNRHHEAMIWTPDGGAHAITCADLRRVLGVEPVLRPDAGTAPLAADEPLDRVDFAATARRAGCAFGWLPVNAVWQGQGAFALGGSRLPSAAHRISEESIPS